MRPESPSKREPAQVPSRPAPAREERHPDRVCPTCGATLLERKCKLLCPDPACGYYMSCSDFC
jgi:hypothetical protein